MQLQQQQQQQQQQLQQQQQQQQFSVETCSSEGSTTSPFFSSFSFFLRFNLTPFHLTNLLLFFFFLLLLPLLLLLLLLLLQWLVGTLPTSAAARRVLLLFSAFVSKSIFFKISKDRERSRKPFRTCARLGFRV